MRDSRSSAGGRTSLDERVQVQGAVMASQVGVLCSKASGGALDVGLPSVPWENAYMCVCARARAIIYIYIYIYIYIWLHEVLVVACRIF